jgi:hypothetical protein
MVTIRFARHRHPEGETERAESFLVPGWRLPVNVDDVALAFGQPG